MNNLDRMKAAAARGKSPPPATPAGKKLAVPEPAKPSTAQKEKPPAPPAPLPSTTFGCGHRIGHPPKVKGPCPACCTQRRTQRAQKRRLQGRLPHGSDFHVTYDAASTTWTGTLTVETADGPVVFTASRSAVFVLMSALDQQWRAHPAAGVPA